jgi:NitT/TauT family transport system substrate-binding protein
MAKLNRIPAWLGYGLLFSLCVAAAVGAIEPVPAIAQAAPISLKFATGGSPPDPAYITPYIARDAGIFRRNGLDVDVASLQGDQLVTQALLSGDIDIGEDGAAAGLAAIAQGAALEIIGSGTPKVDQVLAALPAITSLKAIEGKNYGVSAPGAFSDASARLALQLSGLDISRVSFLPIGGIGNRANALAAGQIDATGLPNLQFIKLTKRVPGIHRLLDFAQIMPDFLYITMVARTEWLQKNSDTATRFMKSIIEASRYLYTNREQSIDIMLKVVPAATREELGQALDGLLASNVYGVDGGISQRSFNYTVDQLTQMKMLKHSLKYNDAVVTKYVDAALIQLGPFQKP